MEIKAENSILTERILAIVKTEKGDVAQDEDEQDDDNEAEQQEPKTQEEPPTPIISKGDDDSSDISLKTSPFGGLQGATEQMLEVSEDDLEKNSIQDIPSETSPFGGLQGAGAKDKKS